MMYMNVVPIVNGYLSVCFVVQLLKNDTRFYHDNLDSLLTEYKQILKDVITPKLSELFNNIPNVPLEIVALPQSGPGSQYIPPSVDGSRPGQFQVNMFD